MTITLLPTIDTSIELNEFCDYVQSNYKFLNPESMVELAPMFKQLANNKSLLEDFIINELKNIDSFQINNPYSSQSLNLYLEPGKFFIRANVWLPDMNFHKVNGKEEKRLFAYYQAHDHNFDFMTIGYCGSGYWTDIYEYNHSHVQGYIGEKVDIKFLETTQLSKGKIMIYRGSKDIHIQRCPDEFSISLNLMAPAPLPVRDQFMFNIETSTVSSIIRSNYSGRKILIEAAGFLANENIKDVLSSITKNHQCQRTREVARISLERQLSCADTKVNIFN